VAAMNRRVAVWAGGDTGKAALASVLRPPETLNFKRHPQVDPVRLEITDLPAWEPEVLDQVIPTLPEPEGETRCRDGDYDGPEIDILEYLAHVEVIGEVQDSSGRKFAVVCPWIHDHTGGDRSGTYAGQFENGALWFVCRHSHCEGRGWREFKEKVQPSKYVRFGSRRATRVFASREVRV
jgi:hypothetical protein